MPRHLAILLTLCLTANAEDPAEFAPKGGRTIQPALVPLQRVVGKHTSGRSGKDMFTGRLMVEDRGNGRVYIDLLSGQTAGSQSFLCAVFGTGNWIGKPDTLATDFTQDGCRWSLVAKDGRFWTEPHPDTREACKEWCGGYGDLTIDTVDFQLPPSPASSTSVDPDNLKAWQHADAWHGTWTRREGGKMYTTYKIQVLSLDMSQKSPVLGGRLKIMSYYEESNEDINCAGIPRYEDGVHTLPLFEVGGKLVPRPIKTRKGRKGRRKASKGKRKASKGTKASPSPQQYDPRHCATMRMFKGECFMDKFRVTCPN